MARIGAKNTKPEMTVRRLLHAAGWRYRLHKRGLPGTPDIVFGSRRAVLFVHGCFWHGHICRLGRQPKSKVEFWQSKMAANRERDARKIAELSGLGWRVMTVWQCSLKQPAVVLSEIEAFLKSNLPIAETQAA